MNVSIKLLSDTAVMPQYQTVGSAAADVMASLKAPVTIKPGERALIPLGFALELPVGVEAQIRARSGLSLKHGLCLANGIGTIDSDYRGEVGVILINLGQDAFTVVSGMRVAQMVVSSYQKVTFQSVAELASSARGEGGYGSTGN